MGSKEYIAGYFKERVIRFPGFYSGRPLLPIEQWIVDQIPYSFARRYSNVLDLCCGGGTLSLALAKRVTRVKGVDYVPEMVDLANALFTKTGLSGLGSFEIGDATSLRFENNTFSHVVCAGSSLNSMTNEDARLVMLEAARVLKPGGTVYFGILNPWGLRSFAAFFKGRLQKAPMWAFYSQNSYGIEPGDEPLPRGMFYVIPFWKMRKYMQETGLQWWTKHFNIGFMGYRAAMTVLIGEKG